MSGHKTPRLAFYGNIANNAFNMVNILRNHGVEAILVDDGTDLFAFSRPCWEECAFDLSYPEVMECRQTLQYWDEKGRALGFSATGRIVSPGSEAKEMSPFMKRGTWFNDSEVDETLRNYAVTFAPTIHLLAGFDLIVAFGFHAGVCAFLAQKPCLYFTYGGDMRLYLANKGGQYNAISKSFHFLLHEPSFCIEAYGCDSEIHGILAAHSLLEKSACGMLPNINLQLFSSPWDQNKARKEVGWPEDKMVFFMAARVDFEWKASDLFLGAFADFARAHSDVMLVVTGWGRHYAEAESMVQRAGLNNQVIFLDKAYAKPELFRRYAAADVVVDQFKLGTFGSVSFEALCMGKPILTFLSPFTALSYGTPPPILNAGTPRDIQKKLEYCHQHPDELPALGAKARTWYQETLPARNLVSGIKGIVEDGPHSWVAHAGGRRQILCDKVVQIPDSEGHVRQLAWPAPFKAGLAFANDCEFYTWQDFCAVHTWLNTKKDTAWGPGLALPISDSFWFYCEESELGFSYFRGIQPGLTLPFTEPMEELIRSGQLDTLHTYGGFDSRGSFTRDHARKAVDECERKGMKIPIWTNHGNENNRQNLGGIWANPYQQGDLPGAPGYHADRLKRLGIRFAWLDSYATNRFSLGNAGGRGFEGDWSGTTHPGGRTVSFAVMSCETKYLSRYSGVSVATEGWRPTRVHLRIKSTKRTWTISNVPAERRWFISTSDACGMRRAVPKAVWVGHGPPTRSTS